MRNFTNFILLIIVLTSCQREDKKNGINKTENKVNINNPYSNIILYDNFDNELILDTISKRRESQFSLVYIGKIKDSIKLSYKISKIENQIENTDWEKFRRPNITDLNIFIATTKTIGFPMGILEYGEEPENRINKKSYPIFIKNKSSDTLKILYGEILPMDTEVQDSIENWKQIEGGPMIFCASGLTDFYLPPNQIAISALRKNYGKKTTKFRVKFRLGDKEVYSNEINGKINNLTKTPPNNDYSQLRLITE